MLLAPWASWWGGRWRRGRGLSPLPPLPPLPSPSRRRRSWRRSPPWPRPRSRSSLPRSWARTRPQKHSPSRHHCHLLSQRSSRHHCHLSSRHHCHLLSQRSSWHQCHCRHGTGQLGWGRGSDSGSASSGLLHSLGHHHSGRRHISIGCSNRPRGSCEQRFFHRGLASLRVVKQQVIPWSLLVLLAVSVEARPACTCHLAQMLLGVNVALVLRKMLQNEEKCNLNSKSTFAQNCLSLCEWWWDGGHLSTSRDSGNLRALPSSPWVNSSHHAPPTPHRRQLYFIFEKKQEW